MVFTIQKGIMSKTYQIHVFVNDKLDNNIQPAIIVKSISNLFGLKLDIAEQKVTDIIKLRESVKV